MSAIDWAGFALFLLTGCVVVGSLYLYGIWRDTLHPPRRTMAWAMAHGLTAHPDDAGWTARERSFPRPDGQQTPAWIVAGSDIHSPIVAILLHGHGRSRWDSLRRAAEWRERSGMVVLADLRGHGEAPGRTTLGREEPADVVAIMLELAAERPSAKFVLAGHSLGAVVSIHAAALAEAQGLAVAAVHAYGPYQSVATPFKARLAARGLPVRPWASILLALMDWSLGKETHTALAASALKAPLDVYADEADAVSPLAQAQAIARAAPCGTLHSLRNVPHADLGVRAGTPPIVPSRAAANTAPPAPCPPS